MIKVAIWVTFIMVFVCAFLGIHEHDVHYMILELGFAIWMTVLLIWDKVRNE